MPPEQSHNPRYQFEGDPSGNDQDLSKNVGAIVSGAPPVEALENAATNSKAASMSQPRFGPANPNYIPPKLSLTDPLTLQGRTVPEREWAVTDWIPWEQVTMLNGDGGIGKSLLALQLLTAAAIGKPWLGLETRPCKAIGFFCEDSDEEIWRRQVAINRHYGIEFGDLENLKWKSFVGTDAMLMGFDRDHGEATELVQQILTAAVDFGAQLLVIDSLHDTFIGNENIRGHARQFINMLRDLAVGIDGAIVLTAHPSLAGLSTGSGFSGSTAWNNAVRSRLYLHRPDGEDPDENERLLSSKKANYAGKEAPLRLLWSEGIFAVPETPSGILASMNARNADRVFLDLLKAVTNEDRHVSESSHASNYAPKFFAKRPDRRSFGKVNFAKAMERLFIDGKIKNETYGPPSKCRQHIVVAPEPST